MTKKRRRNHSKSTDGWNKTDWNICRHVCLVFIHRDSELT